MIMNYGQVIKEKRQAQGISMQVLANILSIDRSVLSRYETGNRNVSKNHSVIVDSYLSGDYDKEIFKLILDELHQKYEHLAGKKGLQLWG